MAFFGLSNCILGGFFAVPGLCSRLGRLQNKVLSSSQLVRLHAKGGSYSAKGRVSALVSTF